MANLMGFQRVTRAPKSKGSSIYDPLIDEALKTKGIYVCDTGDKTRAKHLTTTIRSVLRKRGIVTVKVHIVETNVIVRGDGK